MYSLNQTTSMFVAMILLKSLVLFSFTAAILVALRRSSASSRALAWQMCLFGILLLPLLSAKLPSLRISVPCAANAVANPSINTERQSARPAVAFNAPKPDDSPGNTSASVVASAAVYSTPAHIRPGIQSSGRPAAARRFRVDMLAGILWILGAGFLFLRIGISGLMLWRLRRDAVNAPNPIGAAGRELIQLCGITRRPVRILIGRDSTPSVSPMTWGWLRPVILLPAEAADWPVDRVRPVLLHELGHIARCDWPVLMLADIAVTIYWFHPLVWVMRRRLRCECEKACDDTVLAHGIEPPAYASLLLDIARINCGQQPRPIAAALAIAMASGGANSSMLEKRMRSVLQSCRSRHPVSAFWAAAALLLMALLVSPLSAARLVQISRRSDSSASLRMMHAGGEPSSDLTDGETHASYLLPGRNNGIAHNTLSPSIMDAAPLRSAMPAPESVEPKTAAMISPDRTKRELRDVSWGKISDGLQAGVRIHGSQHRFVSGQWVALDCYIRNTSSAEVAFSFGAHYYLEQVPEIWNNSNPASPRKLKITGVFLTGLDGAYTVILRPGEAVAAYSSGFGLGKDKMPAQGADKNTAGINGYPRLDEPEIGDYTVAQTILYRLMTRDEVINTAKRSRGKPVIIEPHTLNVIHSNGTLESQESTLLPLPADSVPLTSGVSQFSIVDGKAGGNNSPVADNIAWGNPASGLQAGLRSHGNRRQYKINETVEMDYIVRNVSDKPITFEHDVTPGVAGVISDIIDSHGKPAYTLGLPVLHSSEMMTVTLEPGAMTVIGQTRMGLLAPRGSLNDLTGDSKASNWVEALPGSYQIKHLDTLYFTGDRFGKVTLYTGYLLLDIAPRTVKVSWGKTIDGLRAGLSLHDDAATPMLGKEIHTDLYVSNASSHEITISYIANNDKYFVPDLWNARRELLKPDWRNMEIEPKMEETRTLKPGEIQCIAHPFFTVAPWMHGEQAQAAVTSSEGTWYVNQPGKFTVRMTAALISSAADSDAEEHGKPHTAHYGKSIWSYYPTGEVVFELGAK